ncbi:autotransporter domain-containing protein [Achromobacter ruhlandii]|uniref:autotransporter domain-containing protein n=1 Tax=Achromobacter ruhlandii TaxID=72557 RepID=UPI003BA2FAFD
MKDRNLHHDVKRAPPRAGLKKVAARAAVVAIGQAVVTPSHGQPYVTYEGAKVERMDAAVASWESQPEFRADWGLGAMNAQYAYALGFSGAGVKLGAVDSGYLATHQEFANRGVTGLRITGTYRDDGAQLDSSGLVWRAGDSFDRVGEYVGQTDLARRVGGNDNHGNHVSGTIAAAKNGVGMMGVSFNSRYYTSNSNGTDSSVYGANMDYGYFKAAYGDLAAAGARAINTSWGTPPQEDNYGSMGGFADASRRLNGAGKKTWLDAAADVALEHGVLHVWANGNAGAANASVRAGAPYFRPELEKHWIAVTGLNQAGGQVFNQCGLAKYWCLAAPGVGISSANVTGNDQYKSSSGTSMAAPHVTGALGILMERYPYLGNEEIRTILLTTASHRGDGPAAAPNEKYGWGVPDLRKGMDGPAQLLGRFTANLPDGVTDTWKNDISEAALAQRKQEEAAAIDAWPAEKAALLGRIVDPAPATAADMSAGMAGGRDLLQQVARWSTRGAADPAKRSAAAQAAMADPYGKVLLEQYERAYPGSRYGMGRATDFDNFIAGRGDAALAQDYESVVRASMADVNASARGEIDLRQGRTALLAGKTAADYQGSLVKTGRGTLVLAGNNSYSGGTQLGEGTLGVGHGNALGTGMLAVSSGATLQAVAEGLELRNAITVTGLGNVDTQANTLTLSGAVGDGAAAGGMVKLGNGTLVLAGASMYSGATLVRQGTVRAGRANGFSPRSAMLLDAGSQLDLANLDQTIGSLAGSGAVALGTANLTLGADDRHTRYAGQIRGAGGLIKTGAGTLTLGADNSSYTGKVTVAAGGLSMADGAQLGGAVLARRGTVLAGTGALGAATIEAGAVHAPGNPGGAQVIKGDYVNHGTLRINGAPPASGSLSVAGGVDITGGTLELDLSSRAAAASLLASGPYMLVAKQSPGAVTGAFTVPGDSLLFLSPRVSTTGGDGNDVTVALERNGRGMRSVAASPNQGAVADAIDGLPQSHEVWRAIALSGQGTDVSSTLARLSGDTHANIASALMSAAMAPAALNGFAALRHNLAAPRLAGAPTAAAGNAGLSSTALPRSGASPLWVQLEGDSRNLRGDGNAASLTQRGTHLTLGADAAVGGGWRAGGAFGYTDGRLSEPSREAAATTRSYTAAVYGGKAYALDAGTFTLMAGGAYSWHHLDSQRRVRHDGLDQTLKAGYRGAAVQLFTEAGYALPLGEAVTLEPFVGLAWNQLRMQGFTESGGPAALSSDGQRQRNLASLAGLRGDWRVPGSEIALRAMLGWRHVYGNVRPTVSLAFDQGPAFSVAGAPIARDAARVELGVDVLRIRAMTLGLSYAGEFGGGNRLHTGTLQARWRY